MAKKNTNTKVTVRKGTIGSLVCPRCGGSMKASQQNPKVQVCGSCGGKVSKVRI